MGRVDQSIQLERDMITFRVGKHFSVGISRVTDSGAADNRERWTVLCGECAMRDISLLNPLNEFEAPVVYRTRNVDLLTILEFENNMLFYRGLVLAGQCPDCGHAYFATYIPGRKQ